MQVHKLVLQTEVHYRILSICVPQHVFLIELLDFAFASHAVVLQKSELCCCPFLIYVYLGTHNSIPVHLALLAWFC